MIGIITLYHSENCGSVLQAAALRHTLEKLGFEAAFLRTQNKKSSHTPKRLMKNAARHILHLDFVNLKNTLVSYRCFSKTLKNFPTLPLSAMEDKSLKALVLGSDTVWDVTNPYFAQSPQLFWPRLKNKLPVVAYAPSAANASLDELAALGYPARCLNALHAVSARDEHTRQLVKELSGREAPLVLDPTLLPREDFYRKYLVPVPQKPYLLVYCFEKLDPDVIEAIKQYAREKGLLLVSMGRRRDWCPLYAHASVENFVSHFHGAHTVVTNTFHGTAFSIINQRHFVCLGGHKKKIAQLLPRLCLEDRMGADPAQVKHLLNTPTCYQQALPRLEALRADSLNYLKNALSNL